MAWVAVATVAESVIGGKMQSDAAGDAAQLQSDAANNSTALQKDMYDQTVARNAPFVNGGTQSFNALLSRLGLAGDPNAQGYGSMGQAPTQAQVMNEPGYQFGLDQGMNALNRYQNARGLNGSGAQLKQAARYGTDYATQKYGDAFNRYQQGNQQAYNQLAGVAGMGQQSANNTSAYGSQFGSQAGQNAMYGAESQGAGGIQQSNVWTNALNQGISAYKNYKAPTPTTGSMWNPGYDDTNALSGGWTGQH